MKQYRYIGLLLILLGFNACSKSDVEDQLVVNATDLSPTNINTQFAVINIVVNDSAFNDMFTHFEEDIDVDAVIYMMNKQDTILNGELASIGIKGTSTAAYSLKSLKLKFDETIDNTQHTIIMPSKHLPNHHFNKIKKISLRNSGNDFHGSFIKDISYTQLAIDMGLDLELTYNRDVEVFVNSNFYGLMHLRTEKSDGAISNLLQVKKKDVNIIKINHLGDGQEEIEFKDGDKEILQNLVDQVQSGNTAELLQLIDINSFMDYIAYENFIGNSDWPFNNVQLYSVADGRFRFFLYDLDFAGTRDLFFAEDHNKQGFLYHMYQALMQDPEFSQKLIQRNKEIYHKATYENFEAIINDNANRIENEIVYNISKYQVPSSRVVWYYEIEKVLNQFQSRRSAYAKHYNL